MSLCYCVSNPAVNTKKLIKNKLFFGVECLQKRFIAISTANSYLFGCTFFVLYTVCHKNNHLFPCVVWQQESRQMYPLQVAVSAEVRNPSLLSPCQKLPQLLAAGKAAPTILPCNTSTKTGQAPLNKLTGGLCNPAHLFQVCGALGYGVPSIGLPGQQGTNQGRRMIFQLT